MRMKVFWNVVFSLKFAAFSEVINTSIVRAMETVRTFETSVISNTQHGATFQKTAILINNEQLPFAWRD
jgi:hypothetical protein